MSAADKWRSVAGDLWNELEAIPQEHWQPTTQIFIDRYMELLAEEEPGARP